MSSFRHMSRLLVCVFTLGLTLSAAEARAEFALLSCPGTDAAHYSPGLTYTPKTTTTTAVGVLACTVSTPSMAYALINVSSSSSVGCTFSSTQATYTIKWSDGTTSTATGTSVLNARPLGQVAIVTTGTVVSGRFQGAAVVRTVTLLQTQLNACNTATGLTDIAGPSSLELLSLY